MTRRKRRNRTSRRFPLRIRQPLIATAYYYDSTLAQFLQGLAGQLLQEYAATVPFPLHTAHRVSSFCSAVSSCFSVRCFPFL